jgi:hypothetical protein
VLDEEHAGSSARPSVGVSSSARRMLSRSAIVSASTFVSRSTLVGDVLEAARSEQPGELEHVLVAGRCRRASAPAELRHGEDVAYSLAVRYAPGTAMRAFPLRVSNRSIR